MNRLIGTALLLGGLLSACDSQSPALEEPAPYEARAAKALSVLPPGLLDGYEEQPVHLVSFAGRIPGNFAGSLAGLGGEVTFSHEATGIAVVQGLSDAAALKVARLPNVQQVAADVSIPIGAMYDEAAVAFDDAVPASPSNPTTAVLYPRQWDMRTIEADQAWAAGRLGSPGVTIAILDTGIDYLYPDLVGRVDLSRSVSFEAMDDFLVSNFFPTRHPITDLYFHGTHVAMTASSNALILAGVTSQTTLIGVKVCNVSGNCPFSSVIAGLLYATDAGADVANLSLGGAFTKAKAGQLVGFINRVFNYANSRQMTIVVASGNDALDVDHDRNQYVTYCSTPNTICVSATGPEAGVSTVGPWTNVDAPTPYTNYGSSVINVSAPGGTAIANSAGWVWSGCSQTSLVIPVCQTGVFVLGAAGTSMAAPHVAGLAALLIEDVGRAPGRVKTIIQNSADDLGKKGTDPYYGKGRINAATALD